MGKEKRKGRRKGGREEEGRERLGTINGFEDEIQNERTTF